MRLSFWRQADDDKPECVTISEAKELLKEKGGRAWTEHYERDGTLFEVSAIRLAGNNSRIRYNRHL
jgi:endonuclease/exonuclease/phosphatase (EEP) superfamily protein YafD